MNNRNQTLDITKGLLIILVVLGHSIQFGFGNTYCETEQFYDNILFRCIYTFHMPLFMLISGYLFCFTNKKPYKKIIISRFMGIGIPYITYCTLLYIIGCTFYHIPYFDLSRYFFVLKGNMCFLSSILPNCIIISSVTHSFQKVMTIGYAILWVLFLLTFIIPDNYVPVLHKYMYFYFLFGFCINQFSVRCSRLFGNKWLFILLTFLIIVCSAHYEKTLSIYKTGVCVYENGVIDYVDMKIMLLLLCGVTLFLCEIAVRLCNLNSCTILLFLGKIKK